MSGYSAGSDEEKTTTKSKMFRDAPVELCFLDRDLRYIFINEWLAAINGTSIERHLGRTLREVLPDVAAGAESQLRHVLESGDPIIEGTVSTLTLCEWNRFRYTDSTNGLSCPNGQTGQVLLLVGLADPAHPVADREQDDIGEHPDPDPVRKPSRHARDDFGERAVEQQPRRDEQNGHDGCDASRSTIHATGQESHQEEAEHPTTEDRQDDRLNVLDGALGAIRMDDRRCADHEHAEEEANASRSAGWPHHTQSQSSGCCDPSWR